MSYLLYLMLKWLTALPSAFLNSLPLPSWDRYCLMISFFSSALALLNRHYLDTFIYLLDLFSQSLFNQFNRHFWHLLIPFNDGNEKNERRVLSLLKRKVNKNELTFVEINGEVATS
jgi:thiosulfate reductase cytochrome b subunit